MKKCTWALALGVVLLAAMVIAQAALDNDAVIKMTKAGLGEDVIVSMVNGQPGHYTVTPDAIIQLKQSGVSDKIINAMVTKASGGSASAATAAPAAAPPPLVDEIGIYYKKDDKWVEMEPEIVNWKSGGVLKSIASQGLVKGDVNGHIEGKSAKTAVTTPLDFLIYTPDGTAVTEYQLLRLRVSGNSREFRSRTGGVVHSSSGAERDEVDFEGKKIAARTYEIILGQDFKTGEYGFLPPGATSSSNLASSGKIYSFHVLE